MANDFNTENLVNIKVVGVGGGGGNAVNRMIELDSDGKGVEYINVNTDAHILVKSAAPNKISIGDKITKGRGAGADPSLGEKAAEESADAITETLTGANMVFITAGMGGGTGTGAAPVVARIAKSMGILTVAVVTKPFAFEGPKRMRQAEEGIRKLSEYVDSLVVIPNERLKLLTDKKITFLNAFHEADDILCKGVQSICDLITQSGYINLDFADVSTVMTNAGLAHMGVGSAKGREKAEMAAKIAMSSPLLETSIGGAKGIIINILSSPDIGLDEIDTAVSRITEEAHPDANVIFGVAFDKNMEDEIRVTLIATGFEGSEVAAAPSAKASDDEPGKDEPSRSTSSSSSSSSSSDDFNENDINSIIDILNRGRNG